MNIVHLTDSFTRPANTTAYAAGDLIANSTTAGSVVPLRFTVPIGNGRGLIIREVHIHKSGTTITNADFTVRFYGASPTVANGDNGAWSSDISEYIGTIDVGAMLGYTDGGHVVNPVGPTLAPTHVTRSGTIYALLEANAAYTPESGEVFTVEIELEQYPN